MEFILLFCDTYFEKWSENTPKKQGMELDAEAGD